MDDFLDKVLVIPVDEEGWSDYNDEESALIYNKAITNDGYTIIDGLVYQGQKLYVPPEKRKVVLSQSHDLGASAHDGVEGTLNRMVDFYWPDSKKDVLKYIQSCKICQLRKTDRTRPTGMMHSFEAFRPLAQVSLDYLGPLKDSLSGSRFILVTVDNFTRFVHAKAMPDQASATFVRYLNEFCALFGPPETIITDNSKAFDNASVKQFLTVYNINHRFSAPRHHRGNAMVERVTESLQEKISLILSQDETSLD